MIWKHGPTIQYSTRKSHTFGCASAISNVMFLFSYKFSRILNLTESISIRILRMRIIYAIMNFYWSHAISLQKLSNERSYKFSWILTLTEVISIRILRMRINSDIIIFFGPILLPFKNCPMNDLISLAEF